MVEQYLNQFITLANGVKLSILISMIFANLILGVAVSIYTNTFRLKAIADFLVNRVLPYVLGYFAVVIVAIVEPAFGVAVTVVWGAILLALVGSILAIFKEMGINLPDVLAGKKE